MSEAGESGRPPDLIDAILGYRIWRLGANDTLVAVAVGAAWSLGANRAECSPQVKRRPPAHRAPHPGCGCGFNAYSRLDSKLLGYPGTVLGAIAAWGEIDVYGAGFRAECAQVIALALPPGHERVGAAQRAEIERAAERYGVPVVPQAELEATAERIASPVPRSLLPPASPPPQRSPKPRRAARPNAAAGRGRPTSASAPRPRIATWGDARGHAIWVRRHVAVRCRPGVVELAPAPGAVALLGPQPEVRTLEPGARVEAGGVVAALATAYAGRPIHLLAPLGGEVSALNPGFAAELLDGDRRVSSAPWLVAIAPDASVPLDDAPLLWGRPAVELYRQGVIGRTDAAVFADLAPPKGAAAGLRRLPPAAGRHSPRLLPLGSHQRLRTSLTAERGRRAAIMVGQLRPLLQAVGGAGDDDLLQA